MTTNLVRQGDELTWTFDLEGIEQLLGDYFAQDLWSCIEEPPQGLTIELVIAANSDRWSGSMRQRAFGIDSSEHTHVHEIPDAGHWLHVDNPQALLELMAERLL